MLMYISEIRQKIGWSEDWFVFLLIVQLIFLAWILYNYRYKLLRLFGSIGNSEVQKQEFTDQLNWTSAYSVIFMLFYFINISWFAYLCLSYFDVVQVLSSNGFLVYLMLFFGFLLLYMLKLLLLNFIDGFTPDDYGIPIYAFSLSQYNQTTGFLLFPLLVFLSYTPGIDKQLILISILSITGILYLLQIFRGFLNSYKSDAQPFYLILYLCTFEFLPILLALKAFST